jgi:molybdopterin converting factor small subunit
MTKTIRVQYFALLRDQRGLADEKLETAADTPAGLYAELRARHGFTLPMERLRVAVNDGFAPWDAPLHDGDALVFIPPVAGG